MHVEPPAILSRDLIAGRLQTDGSPTDDSDVTRKDGVVPVTNERPAIADRAPIAGVLGTTDGSGSPQDAGSDVTRKDGVVPVVHQRPAIHSRASVTGALGSDSPSTTDNVSDRDRKDAVVPVARPAITSREPLAGNLDAPSGDLDGG